jgi:hypothetical protein
MRHYLAQYKSWQKPFDKNDHAAMKEAMKDLQRECHSPQDYLATEKLLACV